MFPMYHKREILGRLQNMKMVIFIIYHLRTDSRYNPYVPRKGSPGHPAFEKPGEMKINQL